MDYKAGNLPTMSVWLVQLSFSLFPLRLLGVLAFKLQIVVGTVDFCVDS